MVSIGDHLSLNGIELSLWVPIHLGTHCTQIHTLPEAQRLTVDVLVRSWLALL
jgi:hypothetical protein